AAESPKSRNRPKSPVKTVTIPTNPKSFGSRSRANNIREPMRNRKLAPWAQTLARPPRIVFHFRSCIVFSEYEKYQATLVSLERFFKSAAKHCHSVGRLNGCGGGLTRARIFREELPRPAPPDASPRFASVQWCHLPISSSFRCRGAKTLRPSSTVETGDALSSLAARDGGSSPTRMPAAMLRMMPLLVCLKTNEQGTNKSPLPCCPRHGIVV